MEKIQAAWEDSDIMAYVLNMSSPLTNEKRHSDAVLRSLNCEYNIDGTEKKNFICIHVLGVFYLNFQPNTDISDNWQLLFT